MTGKETKSAAIRRLAVGGMERAEIARHLGIRYQHVYNVLKAPPTRGGDQDAPLIVQTISKPVLTAEWLTRAGFTPAGRWIQINPPAISLENPVEKVRGVYAFVMDDRAYYVGLASMGLAKRLYFYAKPGSTQRTSQRLNAMILEHCVAGRIVSIFTATPPDLSWNGLPIDGCAGLELGLIRQFDLPWNVRGT